jgi:hypothetical protein
VRAATEAGADGTRAEHNSIWSVIVPADGTCAATWRRRETSVRPRFMGSSRTSHCLPLSSYMEVRDMKRNGEEELRAQANSKRSCFRVSYFIQFRKYARIKAKSGYAGVSVRRWWLRVGSAKAVEIACV